MGIAKISRNASTALSNITRKAKIPHGLCAKLTAVVFLGLCFIFIWSFFSKTSENLTSQRDSFSDIAEPSLNSPAQVHRKVDNHPEKRPKTVKDGEKMGGKKGSSKKGNHSSNNETVVLLKEERSERSEEEGGDSDGDDVDVVVDGKEEAENEGEIERDSDLVDGVNVDVDAGENDGDVAVVDDDDDDVGIKKEKGKKVRKELGPVFDTKVEYSWKLCSVKSKHNYIPCIDFESSVGKVLRYRHLERSCPRNPPMCLVPLPANGYGTPVRWPESKAKILYKNVEHPKLSAYIKSEGWTLQSEEYLVFPQNHSDVVNGVANYNVSSFFSWEQNWNT